MTTAHKKKIYGIIGAFITLMIPFLLIIFDQNKHLDGAQSLCPFKMLTGFPCPGCGITKSLVCVYEGNIYKSVIYHVLGPFVIVFAIVAILVLSAELITKKEYFKRYFYNKKLGICLAVFLGCYHFIRVVFFIKNHSMSEILKESIWR